MINITIDKKLTNLLSEKNIDVKDYIPAYNGESAGLDLYNTSEDISVYPSTLKSRDLNHKILIPTGLRVIIPKGYVGLIQERGSVTKTNLKVRAGVIDCGYTGEIFVNCVNIGYSNTIIKSNEKLPFQLVVVKCDNTFNVITENEYLELTEDSSRKDGSVGSSD